MSAARLALALGAAALVVALSLVPARRRAAAPWIAEDRHDGRAGTPALLALGAAVPAPAALTALARRRLPGAVVRLAASVPEVRPDVVAAAQAGAASAAAAAGAVLCLATGPAAVLPALALVLAAWIVPVRAVVLRARRRSDAVRTQLPDLLDLLALCVEGGMAVDTALQAAAARLRGPLAEELTLTLRDVALGATRRAAYGDLAERVGLPEITQVVGALLQADELGSPLTVALRAQAAALRDDRRRRARERAARAAPKIQLVVALLMVPAAMLLVVAVMVLELARQVGPVFGGLR